MVATEHGDSFQEAIELIGRRWAGVLLRALMVSGNQLRYNQLLAAIPGISDKVLTERLRDLEAAGILERLVDRGPPIRVSYRLTPRGYSLHLALAAVSVWAARRDQGISPGPDCDSRCDGNMDLANQPEGAQAAVSTAAWSGAGRGLRDAGIHRPGREQAR